MITREQEEWLQHLTPGRPVRIIPYDPQVKVAFAKVQQELQSILGSSIDIQHRGASAMGISGKGDLDIYVPVVVTAFDQTVDTVTKHYGQPGSLYPLQRARWNLMVDGFETEVFVICSEHESWHDTLTIETYLWSHPDVMEQYRTLKEEAEGVDIREYYRRKIEFYNEILSRAKGG